MLNQPVCKKFIGVLAMAMLHPGLARCQLSGYQLIKMHEQEALKTADIINLVRDEDGFLWLASQSGIQRFDGRLTLRFPFSETVSLLHLDNKDRKWVITRQGVYRFSTDTKRFKSIPFEQDGNSGIPQLYQLPDGTLLALKNGKHYRFAEQKELFLADPGALPSRLSKVTIFCGATGNSLYYTSPDSLYQYQVKTGAIYAVAIRSVYKVVPVNNDLVLISTLKFETFLLDIASGKRQNIDSGKGMVIFDAEPLHTGTFLLATNKGLYQYDTIRHLMLQQKIFFQGIPLSNQSSINTLYKDKEGLLFLCHAEGIFLLESEGSFIHYRRNNFTDNAEAYSNDTRSFAEDESGNIWMATQNGILRLHLPSGTLHRLKPLLNLTIPSYRQLLYDGQYLWIGTSGNGVWAYNKKTGSYTRPQFATTEKGKKEAGLFANAYIWKLIPLPGNKLLVAGGSSFFIIDLLTFIAEKVPLPGGPFISRAAHHDSSGRIWHGTTNGFTCYSNNFHPFFSVKDSMEDTRATSFCEWKKNRMLIGSKGLYEAIVADNRILSFRKKKALPAERLIYAMKQDALGYVWIGTDDGLYRYDPLADQATYFGVAEHVQSHAFNSDAAFLSSSGLIFFGGKNGINYFNPSAWTEKPERLYPLITSFVVNGDDSTHFFNSQYCEIPYNNRNIDLTLSAPEFRKPLLIQYRYRLNKKESGWVNTGYSNRIRITSLQPGKYQLQVSASYDGINWFDGERSLGLTVLKPWWQTGWFFLTYAAVATMLTIVLLRYRRRKKEAAQIKQVIEHFTYPGSADTSVEVILWDICSNCISGLGFEDCVIYLLDEERNVLVQKAAYGNKTQHIYEILNPIELQIGQGITGYAAKTGKPVMVKDTSIDSRYIIDDKKRSSELPYPSFMMEK